MFPDNNFFTKWSPDGNSFKKIPRQQFSHNMVPDGSQFIHKMVPDGNSFTNWSPDGNSFTFPDGNSFTKCSQTAVHSQNGPQTTIYSQNRPQTKRYSQSGPQTAIRLPISACEIIAALLSLIVYTHNNGNYHQHLSLKEKLLLILHTQQ